ncbi:MAG: exopolyphosphatase, partial [Pseudomonadota bacterium]
KISTLLTPESARRARLLAALFRVVYLFSAAVEGVLPQLQLKRINAGALALIIPEALMDMVGEKPESRIENLARELGEEIEIVIGT